MNPQISFSIEEMKDHLSTPKFPKNKSLNSLEKEENTLDTLKRKMDKVSNDKDTLNIDNTNESKNEKNILINSYLNNNSNLDLNNCYMSQFSFDEKSSNFLNKKESNENTPNDNNKIELKKEDNNKKDKKDNLIINTEEENNNNEIRYITKKTNEDNDKNEDSNFDYELPLESDNNLEFFNMMSFPENIEEKNEKENNIPEKKIGIGDCLFSNKNINLTPEKKNIKKLEQNINSAKLIEDKKEKFKEKGNDNHYLSKYNTSNKKIDIKFSTLLEENNKINEYANFTERKNNVSNSNNISNNSLKNTHFTSRDVKNSKYNDKINNNDNISITPFTIEKLPDKEKISQKNKIKDNIIKDITISYYDRKNKKNRNSFNYMDLNIPFKLTEKAKKNNNYLEPDNNKPEVIYEKNLSNNDSRSFSISQKRHSYSNSKNFKESNDNKINETKANSNYIINKRLKNSVFLLTKNKNKNKVNNEYIIRNNSLTKFPLTERDNSSQRSLENIKEGITERGSPFRKSKISDSFILKNSYKKNINNKNKLNKCNSKEILSNTSRNITNNTLKEFNSKIENIKKEKYLKSKIKSNKIIDVLNINHNINNEIHYKDFKKEQNCKIKRHLTERNKNLGPVNIYSKKLIFIPNGNNIKENYQNKLKEYTKILNNYDKNKPSRKNNINKSYIIPKEKNIKILQNEINNQKKKKFNEYFKEILSNININKKIMNNKTILTNNIKKESKEKHIIRKIIRLSKIDMNTMTTKTIPTSNKINEKKFQPKFRIRNKNIKENNNTINLTRSSKDLIEKFRNNMLFYSISRNNRNNQVKNEISIFIGDKNEQNNKRINVKKNAANIRNNNRKK